MLNHRSHAKKLGHCAKGRDKSLKVLSRKGVMAGFALGEALWENKLGMRQFCSQKVGFQATEMVLL